MFCLGYEVYLTGKNHQAVVNGVDTTKVNLETFVRLIDAVRLSWNIIDLETNGWYNPRLDQNHVNMLVSMTTDQARRIVAGVLDD